jgi:hypothetical protein
MSNTNNHNTGLVTQMPSVFNRDNSLILNNSEFASLDKAKGDDLTQKEAIDMIKNINGMVIYKKPIEIGGYMVGTPQEAMDYFHQSQLSQRGRDIGNIGAGYVAGSILLPWSSTRLGFDGYNFIKNGQLTESPVSKEAQIRGFILGNPVYRNISNLSKELKK